MRRRWGALRKGLSAVLGDLSPTFWVQYNAKGQRGCRWREVDVKGSDKLWASWQWLKADLSQRLVAWLNRYGLDEHGQPIVVEVHNLDDLRRRSVRSRVVAPAVAASALAGARAQAPAAFVAPATMRAPARLL